MSQSDTAVTAGSGFFSGVVDVVGEAVRRRPARVLLVTALTVLEGVFGAVGILMLVPVIEGLGQDGVSRMTLPLIGEVAAPLPRLLAVVVVIVVAQALFLRFSAVTTARLRFQLTDELAMESMHAVLQARWSFFLSRRSSDVLFTLRSDITRAAQAVDQASRVFGSLVTLLFTVLVALVLSPVLSLVSVVMAALVAGFAVPNLRAAHRLGSDMSARGKDALARTSDAMSSIRMLRAHDAADYWLRSVRDGFGRQREVALENQRRAANVQVISRFGTALGAAAVILAGYVMAVPTPNLLVLLFVYSRIVTGVMGLITQYRLLAVTAPAMGEVTRLTREARASAEVPEPAAGLQDSTGRAGSVGSVDIRQATTIDHAPAVSLSDVRYRYPNSQRAALVLDHVEIPAGRVTALTGHSGAGKSTLVDVVLGLLTPQAGQVTVDGRPLGPSALRWWRAQLAYVPQDVDLLPGTLRANLTWGSTGGHDPTDEECRQILRAVSAGFVDRLPDGLDTELGERGVRLSGGEKQRVALARALLRRPRFLVLDEATSALDGVTEAAVHRLINELSGQTTVLVVAHRATTVATADHIVLLADGRVVEQGPAQRLLSRGSSVVALMSGLG